MHLGDGGGGDRFVVEALKKPVQVRHGTPDARLLGEITLAAGFTAYLTKPLQIDSALTSIDTALSDRKIII